MLQTGDTFRVKVNGVEHTYMFLGFDNHDVESGIGNNYLVLRNLDLDEITCVEAAWFCTALTGRQIFEG